MPKKVTGKVAASKSSKVLKSDATSGKSKTAAGSAMSQTKSPNKQTSANAASKASAVLKDGRTSPTSKSAAGSTLSQKESKSKSTTKIKTTSTGPRRGTK